MMIFKRLILVSASITLIACTATAEKTDGTAPEITSPEITKPEATKPIIPNNNQKLAQSSAGKNQIASPDNISRLQSQITALQEQLIKVNNDTAAILQMSQVLMAQSQANASVSSQKRTNPEKNNKAVANTSDKRSLNSILKKLEDISPSPQGSFGIVSSYTARKQWVLIRFDRQTGETWLADNSGWNLLLEDGELPVSQYDVHLIRADQDQKGFVASRIDKRSGDTWWLNKNKWVVYQ